jgi:hypothetical protein
MTISNIQRAERLADVLRRYTTDNTDAGCLTDFLADARHWCDQNQQDYADLDRRAYQHYVVEVVDERRQS